MDIPLFVLPLVYLLLLALVIVTRKRSAATSSIVAVIAAVIVGFVAIWHSHSSTAAIGFLFLPSAAAVVGAVALVIPLCRASESAPRRVLGYVALATTIG
jgi:lysophospholipid acyltransferase (LPLAT)-like uncharacterized protein